MEADNDAQRVDCDDGDTAVWMPGTCERGMAGRYSQYKPNGDDGRSDDEHAWESGRSNRCSENNGRTSAVRGKGMTWIERCVCTIAVSAIAYLCSSVVDKLSQVEKDIMHLRLEVARLKIPSDEHIKEIVKLELMERLGK